jgi:hypothetical protein
MYTKSKKEVVKNLMHHRVMPYHLYLSFVVLSKDAALRRRAIARDLCCELVRAGSRHGN